MAEHRYAGCEWVSPTAGRPGFYKVTCSAGCDDPVLRVMFGVDRWRGPAAQVDVAARGAHEIHVKRERRTELVRRGACPECGELAVRAQWEGQEMTVIPIVAHAPNCSWQVDDDEPGEEG